MRITPVFTAAVAAATLVGTLAPSAAATGSRGFANADGSVRCELAQFDSTHETLCVSQRARESQPECNPPQQLIPAIAIQDRFVGKKCWNQGFGQEPERLQPFQIRSYGQATVIPGLSGTLYVLDIARLALIQAGAQNQVLFGAR